MCENLFSRHPSEAIICFAYTYYCLCSGAETGRPVRLRGVCLYRREGSSPSLGTKSLIYFLF